MLHLCLFLASLLSLSCLDVLQRQREMIGLFREGKLNFLVCTNIGSEGMDFRQCQVGNCQALFSQHGSFQPYNVMLTVHEPRSTLVSL